MALGYLYVLLGEVSVEVLCPFFIELSIFLVLSHMSSLHIADQTFVQGIIGKYIFPYGRFHFNFADLYFIHAEIFQLDLVPFVYSFFYIPFPRRYISEENAVWDI